MGVDWVLLMVGEGELRRAAETFVASRNADNIIFPGWLDQSRISLGYSVADIFVLPSEYQETWGLVVNEAMNFGCPIVVSDRVGCAPTLVENICGYVVPFDDVFALTGAIRRLAFDDELQMKFGKAAKEKIAHWGIDEYMKGLRKALYIEK